MTFRILKWRLQLAWRVLCGKPTMFGMTLEQKDGVIYLYATNTAHRFWVHDCQFWFMCDLRIGEKP